MTNEGFVIHVNDSNFEEEVLKSDKPTLVDFWAPWCGPCVPMGSIIEELAKEYKDRAKMVKLNVDDSPNTAGNYGIRAIPTLLLFKDGDLEETLVGLTPKDRLKDLLKKVL
ncbi:MAG: thioredoxin [Deltaproteobacteria bacterium]|nr:thioredoxin [Deltaproteobacteria bacterium]MBN2846316.1 thioredoxin [Deltaproteobacteria bacterium]